MDLSELKLKRSLGAAHIPEKGHNDIFWSSFFSHDNNGMEQTPERSCYHSISLYY